MIARVVELEIEILQKDGYEGERFLPGEASADTAARPVSERLRGAVMLVLGRK